MGMKHILELLDTNFKKYVQKISATPSSIKNIFRIRGIDVTEITYLARDDGKGTKELLIQLIVTIIRLFWNEKRAIILFVVTYALAGEVFNYFSSIEKIIISLIVATVFRKRKRNGSDWE